jgi:hypothetical protein
MTPTELLKPILGGGIRSVNFFNGRLLSGEDLSKEQEANREGRKMLGRAIGEGVAYGLEVSRAAGAGANATVRVDPGIAINRGGGALRLASAIDLSLVRPQEDSAQPVGSTFVECRPFQSGVYVTGSGAYLLVVSPARVQEGRALVSGLQDAASDCNVKYLVDGVQFRLVPLDLTANELGDQARLRNLIAYKCFGTAETKSFVKDPFGPKLSQYGLLDTLRPNRLTDCDVPLAVLHWTASEGIKFVDNWPVRRRVTASAASANWSLLVGDRRASEAEAMFLQFEDHIRDIQLNETSLGLIAASGRFHYLPAAGLLPIAAAGSPSGFDLNTFFGARASKDVAMTDGDLLRSLMKDALYHEPIDVRATEKIQLYLIRENVQSVESGQSAQLALVFANHRLPYRGVARFGRARWDLSRFAPSVI